MSLLSIKFCADQDRFLREFLQLSFVEQAFSDCTLYCWAEERTGSNTNQSRIYRTFKCHRLVLSAYSDFFRHCFLDSAKSNVSSLFLDIEPRTLENVLRLIYFGQIEIVQSDIELFFNAATKLSLKDFKIVNSNEVFNVDSDLNHLKRRLTQDESFSLKSTKHSKGAVENKSIDKESTNEDTVIHDTSFGREETKCQDLNEKPPTVEQQKQSLIGLISSSLPKLNFTPTSSIALPDTTPAQESNSSAYTCTICNKQYSYKISLNKHIKSAHAN